MIAGKNYKLDIIVMEGREELILALLLLDEEKENRKTEQVLGSAMVGKKREFWCISHYFQRSERRPKKMQGLYSDG